MKQPVTLAGSWVFFDWESADLLLNIPPDDSLEFSLSVDFDAQEDS